MIAVNIPIWIVLVFVLFTGVLIYLFLMTLDQGHHGYVVINERVVQVLAPILAKHSGIKELVTCTTEPVDQVMKNTGLVLTIPSNGITLKNVEPGRTLAMLAQSYPPGKKLMVIELVEEIGYLPNFLSVLAHAPLAAIKETYEALIGAGFTAYILYGFMKGSEEKITLIASDAFVGWILVFRRHLLFMPIPSNPRLITRVEGWVSLPKVMRVDSKVRAWIEDKSN